MNFCQESSVTLQTMKMCLTSGYSGKARASVKFYQCVLNERRVQTFNSSLDVIYKSCFSAEKYDNIEYLNVKTRNRNLFEMFPAKLSFDCGIIRNACAKYEATNQYHDLNSSHHRIHFVCPDVN